MTPETDPSDAVEPLALGQGARGYAWDRIAEALCAFYAQHRRDLPWRRTRDPYAIWISEVMLQQTQVDTVVTRYRVFLREFPTAAHLAQASERRVCEAWAGLGYYGRARRLHAAARAVVRDHGGVLPGSAAALLRLPGIGRYTAGAVASIAFGEAVAAVDGNVTRVMTRLFAMEVSPQTAAGARQIWAMAEALIRAGDAMTRRLAPGDLNQALMELGALVCTPRRPGCDRCPVAPWCMARVQGAPDRFPQGSARVTTQPMDIGFAWIRTAAGVWLEQRPLRGLWAGLWEPPSAHGRDARKQLAQRTQVELSRSVATVRHKLSHRDITARVYIAKEPPAWRSSPRRRRFPDPLAAPLSGLARKVVHAVEALGGGVI